MRRIVVLLGLFLLSLVLVLPGCAPSTPQTQGQGPAVVDFIGSRYGTVSFITMYAASDLVNKYSTTVKGLVQESFGTVENLKRLDQDKEERKHAVIMVTGPAMVGAKNAQPKEVFDKPIKGILYLFNAFDAGYSFGTTDPNIKTPADLVGKRVDAGPYGNYYGVIGDTILEAYGVKDKLARLEHSADQNVMYSALIDGKVDAIAIAVTVLGPNNAGFSAVVKETAAARKLWLLDTTEDMIAKAVKTSGIPFYPFRMQAKLINPDAPAYLSMAYPLPAAAHQDMPENLVYEVMKVAVAHVTDFGKYSNLATALTKDRMAAINTPVEEFHPGAVKAYREAGMKVGVENYK